MWSKSRKSVEILKDKKIKFQIIDYQKTKLSIKQLKNILEKLELPIDNIIRKKDKLYKELGIKKIKDEHTILEMLSKNIKLLERPIIVKDDQAVIGRPPEKLNELFD